MNARIVFCRFIWSIVLLFAHPLAVARPFVGISFTETRNTTSITSSPTTTYTFDPATSSASRHVSQSYSFERTFSRSPTTIISETATSSRTHPSCSHVIAMFPASTALVRFGTLSDTPPEALNSILNFYEVPAASFSRHGLTLIVALNEGIFDYQEEPKNLIQMFVKSRLMYQFVDVANVERLLETDVFRSQQSRGFSYFLENRRSSFSVQRSFSFYFLTFPSFDGYRIAADEWLFVKFHHNSTAPFGCVNQSAVLRIKSYEATSIAEITFFITFWTMLGGIVSALAGTTLATSHHSQMVTMLALVHVGDVDGRPLPFALHPAQIPLRTNTKYRYVNAAAVFNSGFICLVFLLQCCGIYYKKRCGCGLTEAKAAVFFPRITMVVFVHLCCGIWYATGRSLGERDVTVLILCGALVLGLILSVGGLFRRLISPRFNFLIRFVPMEETATSHWSNVFADRSASLEKKVRLLLNYSRGHWKAIDHVSTFLQRHGYIFEAYAPHRAKFWMGLEMIDFMLCGLMTVSDNYNLPLALYQFGLFCGVKAALFFFYILSRPAVNLFSNVCLGVSYGGQLLASFCLFASPIRTEFLEPAMWCRDVFLLFVAMTIAAEILFHILASLLLFRERVREMHSHYKNDDEILTQPFPLQDLQFLNGFLVGSAAAENEEVRLQLEVVEANIRERLPQEVGDNVVVEVVSPPHGLHEQDEDSADDSDGLPKLDHPRNQKCLSRIVRKW